MRPVDNNGCYNHNPAQENNATNSYNSELHKGNGTTKSSHHRKILGSRSKPTPSKWDDAQKWLAGISGSGDHSHQKNKPRNSNADDRRLLNSASQKARESCSSADFGMEEYIALGISSVPEEGETKKIDCSESSWRMSKPVEEPTSEANSVYLRDVGTEMTPIASQEPSRTATPIRATTPVLTSPINSRSSTPGRNRQGAAQPCESHQVGARHLERRNETVIFGRSGANGWLVRGEGDVDGCRVIENNGSEQIKNPTALESRAMAWDEAERAKYMARYKREEVKIQAWENHEKRKADMEMKRKEVKAERLKIRAQERLANKLAATRRIAEEKRANAEAKLNEQAAKTSERADYIRRTGHLPSSFNISFKMPSLCG